MLGWLARIFRHPGRRLYCCGVAGLCAGLSEWELAWYDAAFGAAKRSLNEALDRGELNEPRQTELLRPLEELCRQLSGEDGLEPSHLFKHRVSLYGPPCRGCGRNLRTPKASRCMSCGLEKGR